MPLFWRQKSGGKNRRAGRKILRKSGSLHVKIYYPPSSQSRKFLPSTRQDFLAKFSPKRGK
jgi:hypothetical protein